MTTQQFRGVRSLTANNSLATVREHSHIRRSAQLVGADGIETAGSSESKSESVDAQLALATSDESGPSKHLRPRGERLRQDIPGAGKTVLASIIVNHLRTERNEAAKSSIGIAVVYIKYDDPDKTLDNFLGSFLKQLVQESDFIPQPVLELYEHHRDRNTAPSLDELSDVLKSTIETFAKVYFVVDALDECSEEIRWNLIEKLERYHPKLHLLITSRYLDSIAEELVKFTRFEVKAHRADIELFIDHQIKKNRNLRKIVEKSSALRTEIKDVVVRTAANMFLLARLHVESLTGAAALSVKHVRNKLRTLPTTLAATYDSAMQRIQDQEPDHRGIALKTLAWVTYAFRSLNLRELQHALAIEPGDAELDEELIMDGHSITSLCAGLVIIDQCTNVVNLVHYSTKSYFEETRAKYFPKFHASITLSSATYLTLKALKDVPIGLIVQEYPLACYAAQYLGEHARNTPEEALEPSILEVICQLLSHPEKRKPLLSLLDGLDLIQAGFYSTNKEASETLPETITSIPTEAAIPSLFKLSIHPPAMALQDASQPAQDLEEASTSGGASLSSLLTGSDMDESTLSGADELTHSLQIANAWDIQMKTSRTPEVTALHLAASMGLAKVAPMLLKETPNIDALDETGKTALAVAMKRGFEKAFEFLVNSGASVDLRYDHGRSVLLHTAERDWHCAGDIIVQKSRSASTADSCVSVRNQVRFILAAYHGSAKEILHLAQEDGVDVKHRDRSIGELALFLAVERGWSTLVKTILEAGVDVNATDSAGKTALHRATRRADEGIVRLLLSNKAEVDVKDDNGRTAWSANVQSRNLSILGILLEAGADPSTKGIQGLNELYVAAKNGDTELVRFMLESGTDPSISTEYDWTPLHWASSYGHIDCVRLLIEAGADLSVVSDQNVTPLDLAIHANQHAIVNILQQAGAKQAKEVADIASSVATLRDLALESDWVRMNSSPNSLIERDTSSLTMKLVLVFDKPLIRTLVNDAMVGQFIYPRKSTKDPAPDGYIFQISHPLESQVDTINVRISPHRAEMHEYPLDLSNFDATDVLYDIQRVRS